jgi:hypothetical protein
MHVRIITYYIVIWISVRSVTLHGINREIMRYKFKNDQQPKYYGIYRLSQNFSIYLQTQKTLNCYGGMLMAEKIMECSVTLATPPNGETLT